MNNAPHTNAPHFGSFQSGESKNTSQAPSRYQTILGANGTIGSVLARELIGHTSRIRLVSRNPRKVNETDELLSADLSDPANVEKAVAGSDVVYLLVGFEYEFKVWQERWPRLMRATLDACIKHGAKLVFFDNMYLYDKAALGHMTEASAINPPSRKGMVRKQIADMLMDEVKKGRVEALIARAADFYGPGNERSFLIQAVYKNLKKGKRPNWFADGNKKHSFTFTPDAARATALLGNTPDAYGQVWHLPTDPGALTGAQMAEVFMQEMKVSSSLMVVPKWMIQLMGLFVPFMQEMVEMVYQYDRDYIFDSSKFENRFKMKATPYREGVRQTVLNS